MTDKQTKDKAKFKPINVSAEDWDMYNQFAITLSATEGERISIPALLKRSVQHYFESL